jgi:hypothetical protein
MAAKYSYEYEFIKPSVKAGINAGDRQFFDKKKGDELVKAGWLKFVNRYKLGMHNGATCLIPA